MHKQKNKTDFSTKSHSLAGNIFYTYKYVWHNKKSLIFLLLLFAFFTGISPYIWSFATKYIIDSISVGQSFKQTSAIIAAAVVINLITKSIIKMTDSRFWYLEASVSMSFLRKFNLKMMKMNFENLENPKILDYAERAQIAASFGNNGFRGLMEYMHYFLNGAVVLLISAIMILKLNPIVAAVIVILALLSGIYQGHTKKVDKEKCWDKMAPFYRRFRYFMNISTDFAHAKDLRIYNMGTLIKKKQEHEHAKAHKMILAHKNRWLTWEMGNYVIKIVQTSFLYGWLILSVIKGTMSIGNFTLYASVVTTFSLNLRYMFNHLAELKFKSMQINDYRAFMSFEDKVNSSGEKKLPHDILEKSWEFEFKNVSFIYKGSEHYALKNLSLKIKSGEKLAVVGLNGAGKTTFIKLLCRLYDVTDGQILLNGTDIREYDRNEYQRLFAPVFQNVELFAMSMAENVSMKPSSQTDFRLCEECLLKSGLNEKVSSFKNGLNTELLKNIYKEGEDLSGGERQKLSLAKALYKNSPVIILDEPTAALDAIAEYRLYQSFSSITNNKTAIYISHRLSSTRFCDVIAMFKDGTVAEYGTHDELLKKGGEYAELFEVQARYYKDNDGKECEQS